MRRYRLLYEAIRWGPDDLDEAKELFKYDDAPRSLSKLVDVQQLPQRVTSEEVEDMLETAVGDEEIEQAIMDEQHRQFIPDGMGVTHPWDQGLWIFPEDHPLHDYEVLAKAQGDKGKETFRKLGVELKELPAPE